MGYTTYKNYFFRLLGQKQGNLRNNPAFFGYLLDAVPAAIYHSSYDPAAERWTIRFVSRGIEGLLGYKPEELENKMSFKELALSNLHHYRLFQEGLTPQNPHFRLTFEFRTASGLGKWVSDDGRILFDAEGRVCGSVGVFVDISEHKAQELSIKEENLRLKTTLRSPAQLGGMVGKSPAMQEVFSRILKLALTTAHLVILGESGTGKELAARAIHDLSNRSASPFVPVNCSSISDTLFESEFFGYVKGAFTGASQDRQGYLCTADKGTIFLDEVGDIPLNMQTKLLRALDGYGYVPVGGRKVRHSDFRLISATNRNLEQLVKKGLMREDFYYRINAVTLNLPPLRERQGDIAILVDYFLGKRNLRSHDLPQDFMERLLIYSWPGNIRELQNILSRYVAFQDTEVNRLLDSPLTRGGEDKWNAPPEKLRLQERPYYAEESPDNFEEFEKLEMLKALKETRWQAEEAAARLGLSRSTMYRKMRKYCLLKKSKMV